VVILLVLAVAAVVTGWLSRDLVRRLKSTGEAARALADGDLAHRAPEQGHDEITDLAGHFNHMAERIQALVGRLRRSEQARKDLLVMVSHELRTPMTSISGFAEALRDGVVQQEDRKQRYYQIIAAESARLNRLVNDLFDMARLEAGQAELNLQAMSAAPWLVEFTEAALPAAEAAGARMALEVSPEAERSRIYGDRDRLDQVLTNLTGNAVRFTPEGAPVTIQARVDDGYLVVAVSDRGPGLTPDEAERVFDRFFQGNNQGRDHKGAGLGLSIVKTLVEAHGGRVGVESAAGVGSTFWFRLRVLER
jgi:two-component system OmpR family sensor kinase